MMIVKIRLFFSYRKYSIHSWSVAQSSRRCNCSTHYNYPAELVEFPMPIYWLPISKNFPIYWALSPQRVLLY